MSQQIEYFGEWFGLYAGDTSKERALFTQRSIKHPAKGAIPLFLRIFDQLKEWGLLKTGDLVIDPFMGRATTNLLWCSLHPSNKSIGVEVEKHFWLMDISNLIHSESMLRRKLLFEPILGDSRKIDVLIQESRMVKTGCASIGASSPPYFAAQDRARAGKLQDGSVSDCINRAYDSSLQGDSAGQIGNLPQPDEASSVVGAASPAYGGEGQRRAGKIGSRQAEDDSLGIDQGRGAFHAEHYGTSEGQIANLPEDDMPTAGGESLGVCSPTYGKGTIGKGNAEKMRALVNDPKSSLYGRNPEGEFFNAVEQGYVGSSPENIDHCPDPDSPGMVGASSPAYEDTLASDDPDRRGGLFRDPKRRNDKTLTGTYAGNYADENVGVTSGPFADTTGDTDRPKKHTKEYEEKYGKLNIAKQNTMSYGGAPGKIGSLPPEEEPPGVVGAGSPAYEDTEIIQPEESIGKAFREKGQSARASLSGDVKSRRYGKTPGQIGAMPTKDSPVGVGSGPYTGDAGFEATDSLQARDSRKGKKQGKGVFGPTEAYGNTPGQIGAMPDPPEVIGATSPVYPEAINNQGSGIDNSRLKRLREGRRNQGENAQQDAAGYGAAPGQIGELPDDSARVIGSGSPPYSDTAIAPQGAAEGWNKAYQQALASGDTSQVGEAWNEQVKTQEGYGGDPAQIGRLADPQEAVGTTSQPYEAQTGGHGEKSGKGMIGKQGVLRRHSASNAASGGYGKEKDQIGNQQGETYAQACESVYAAMARAGVNIFVLVTKNPVRNGAQRRLDLLTWKILDNAGYRVFAVRYAYLWDYPSAIAKRKGEESLFGDLGADSDEQEKPKGRLSFFAQLQLVKRGLPMAKGEVVTFAVRKDWPGYAALMARVEGGD